MSLNSGLRRYSTQHVHRIAIEMRVLNFSFFDYTTTQQNAAKHFLLGFHAVRAEKLRTCTSLLWLWFLFCSRHIILANQLMCRESSTNALPYSSSTPSFSEILNLILFTHSGAVSLAAEEPFRTVFSDRHSMQKFYRTSRNDTNDKTTPETFSC